MLELSLRSGQVVAFDGRVVEVFAADEPSCRFHVGRLSAPAPVASDDGSSTLALGCARITFAREEAPACARLLAALARATETGAAV